MAYTGNLIPIMTSNTNPQGLASASSERSSTYAAWKAFDGDSTTWWSSTSAGASTCNLNYTFIIPQVIDKYTVTSTTTTNTAPKTWKFQGRIGSTWTDLDTQASVTGWGSKETKTYTFTNTTAYWEYRINITANNGGTYTEITTMEMMATIAGHVIVPAVDLQTEILASQSRVSSLNLQTEVRISDVKIPSLNLQIEVITTTPTSRFKIWDGSAYTAYPLKRWDGSSWVDVSSGQKWYDGGWQS